MDFIDLKTQQNRIKNQIDTNIAKVLSHGHYIMGPEVKNLEERLADYVGVKYCIGVSSGTDALLIAMMAELEKVAWNVSKINGPLQYGMENK